MARCVSDPDKRRQAIWQVVHAIPVGRVCTYGDVALLAGLPGRARLVGRVLSELPPDSALPWYRVISASGRIAFAPESEAFVRQRQHLQQESLAIAPTGRLTGWPDCRWQG